VVHLFSCCFQFNVQLFLVWEKNETKKFPGFIVGAEQPSFEPQQAILGSTSPNGFTGLSVLAVDVVP